MSTFDTSEINQLAVDLVGSLDGIPDGTAAVMGKAGLEVKKAMKAQASGVGIREAAALAATITYDTTTTKGAVSVEIGPRRGGAGSFAFLYYGNSKNGPVIPDPVIIARTEGEVVAGFLATLAAESLA